MTAQTSHPGLPQWTLGDRLQKARRHAGLTRDEMADRLGISRNTVLNYETDHTTPPARRRRLWALVTGVPDEWLVDGVDNLHLPPVTEREVPPRLSLVPSLRDVGFDMSGIGHRLSG